MFTFKTIAELSAATLLEGDVVKVLGEINEGDSLVKEGVVHLGDYVTQNRTVTIANGLRCVLNPVGAQHGVDASYVLERAPQKWEPTSATGNKSVPNQRYLYQPKNLDGSFSGPALEVYSPVEVVMGLYPDWTIFKPYGGTFKASYLGIKGDGSDETSLLQQLIDITKHPIDVTNQYQLNSVKKTVVDFESMEIMISSPIDFDTVMFSKFQNGTIRAMDLSPVVWNGPVLNIAAPDALDIFRQQRIRNVSFENMFIFGSYVTDCIYLENTYEVTFDGTFWHEWKDGGYGLYTADRSTTPIKKNTHLTIRNTSPSQHPLSVASGDGSGTAISIKTADFYLNKVTPFKCDVAFHFDNASNGQMVQCHSFVGANQRCLWVGKNFSNLCVTNFYSDTGNVWLDSFDHVFEGCIFVANSQIHLNAFNSDESAIGLVISGQADKNIIYSEDGGGTWRRFKRHDLSRLRKGGEPMWGGTLSSDGFDTTLGESPFSLYANNTRNTRYFNRGWVAGDDALKEKIILGDINVDCQVHSNDGRAGFGALRLSNDDNNGGTFIAAKSKSLNGFSPFSGAVSSGNVLGQYLFAGANGSAIAPSAGVDAIALESWSNGSTGSRVRIRTTNKGTSTVGTAMSIDRSSVQAGEDNVASLGNASIRWSELYAANGTINTSDGRHKTLVDGGDIPDTVLDAWANVPKCQYWWNDSLKIKGEVARVHFGIIAQDVIEQFEVVGLDATKYGVLCYDEWPEEEVFYESVWKPVYDEEGKPLLEKVGVNEEGGPVYEQVMEEVKAAYVEVIPAGNRYGIRYEQAAVS